MPVLQGLLEGRISGSKKHPETHLSALFHSSRCGSIDIKGKNRRFSTLRSICGKSSKRVGCTRTRFERVTFRLREFCAYQQANTASSISLPFGSSTGDGPADSKPCNQTVERQKSSRRRSFVDFAAFFVFRLRIALLRSEEVVFWWRTWCVAS